MSPSADPQLVDVAVVGDGPAGAAIAAACDAEGLRTVVVGSGRPWSNTYGAWVDEVPTMPDSVWSARTEQVIVGAERLHRVDRAYGVFDNDGLRRHLGLDERLCTGRVVGIDDRGDGAEVRIEGERTVRARWAVDARGADGAAAPAWQTAYGVVVDESVAATVGVTDATTLMDWSWSGALPTPSFLYMIPFPEGWLVEHTVLAAAPAVEPQALRAGLVERLGAAAVEAAEASGLVEEVRIPMGIPPAEVAGRVVPFGANAGFAHPATGYSVAASLSTAPRVASAMADDGDVGVALWPAGALRARHLHDVGLDALLRLDASGTAAFFDAFFDLPLATWSDYMRTGDDPRRVARAMFAVFRRSPWSVRRRLARPDRRLISGLLGR